MFLSNKRNMMGSLVFLEKPESFKTAVITNRLIITTIFFPSVSFLVFLVSQRLYVKGSLALRQLTVKE